MPTLIPRMKTRMTSLHRRAEPSHHGANVVTPASRTSPTGERSLCDCDGTGVAAGLRRTLRKVPRLLRRGIVPPSRCNECSLHA